MPVKKDPRMRHVRLLTVVCTGFGLLSILARCSNPVEAETKRVLSVDAGPVQVVSVNDTISLSASVSSGIAASRYEWRFGDGPFVRCSSPDTFTIAPSAPDTAYPCVFRVTDGSGNEGLDTVLVWVVAGVYGAPFRIISPNGGERFYAGNSIRIALWPVPRDAGVRLVIGDQLFPIEEYSTTFKPSAMPEFSFNIAETYTYLEFNPDSQKVISVARSPVSDSCRIRVYNYFNEDEYTESAGFFSIVNEQ